MAREARVCFCFQPILSLFQFFLFSLLFFSFAAISCSVQRELEGQRRLGCCELVDWVHIEVTVVMIAVSCHGLF
jgi:hypothetical protein